MAENEKVLVLKTSPIEDDYIIDWSAKLGSGVSGPVRLCTSRATGQKFALKCLVDSTKSRTEAQNHYKCSGHPHIVSVVDAYCNRILFPGEMRGMKRVLLVLELMEGGELFELIRSKKKFTESEAAMFTRQITLGLYHCHSFNIAHRDLKPENLLLKDKSDNIVIKLADFGFAKVDRGDLVTPQFTPYYVSPQVLEAQKIHRAQKSGRFPFLTKQYTYDKSCDMWSLGVIIYIMLCGYPPFYSEVPRKQLSQGMRKKIMAGEYEFPEAEWTNITAQAKDVISRLLRVEPAQRMSVQDLLEHPWLNSDATMSPEVALYSPAIIADEEAFEEAMNAHSAQLTNMRLPDRIFMLKTVKSAKNPILEKRRVLYNSIVQAPANPNEAANRDLGGPAVKSLRDLIAFCILAPTRSTHVSETSPEAELHDLVQKAVQHNPGSARLMQALSKESWDGEKFLSSMDRRRLAKSLSDIVRKMC